MKTYEPITFRINYTTRKGYDIYEEKNGRYYYSSCYYVERLGLYNYTGKTRISKAEYESMKKIAEQQEAH